MEGGELGIQIRTPVPSRAETPFEWPATPQPAGGRPFVPLFSQSQMAGEEPRPGPSQAGGCGVVRGGTPVGDITYLEDLLPPAKRKRGY